MNGIEGNNGANQGLGDAFAEAASLQLQNSQNLLKNPRMKDFTSLVAKFICLYGILSLFSIDIVLSILKNDTKQVLSISENWSLKPIIEISIINGTCPPDFENIINGVFLGTNVGCKCERRFPKYEIQTGTCSSNDQDNCDDIPSVEPVPLDNINGLVICVKRAHSNFTSIDFPSTTCSSGFKPCGSTHNYFICVPSEQDCPITDIQIIPISHKTPSSYSKIPFDSSHKLIYTRNHNHNNRLPIVDFRFEEGQPCIDPEEHPSPPDVEWHLLDRKYSCTVKIEGERQSTRYHEFFSVSEYELYSHIKLTNKLEELPGYNVEKFKKYKRSMYWASWIPWSVECEKDTGKSREIVAMCIDKVRGIADSQRYIFNLTLAGLILMAGLHIIVWIRGTTNRWGKRFDKASQLLSLIFVILEIIELIKIIFSTRALDPDLKILQAVAHCSDSVANYSLSHITLSLKYNQYADIIAVLILFFILLVKAGTFFILWSSKKIKKD